MGGEPPVFIGGAGRSGKTLVRWILSAHPRIVVTRRTDLWPRFSGRFGDLVDDANLDRCVRAIMTRKQVASLGIDPARLLADARSGERTYGRLFALLHEQVAERHGAVRWGDQSASIEAFADDLVAAYGEVRLIHLIRDPRDRLAAERRRDGRRVADAGRSVAAWLRSARLAERNRGRYPEMCLVLRYEDLVERPEPTIRDVCAFLGEAFEPAMLRLEDVARYRDVRAASPDGSPITDAFLGIFRSDLAAADVAFVEGAAAEQMRAFGYEPEALRLSPAQRVRAAVARPGNVMAMRVRPRDRAEGARVSPRMEVAG